MSDAPVLPIPQTAGEAERLFGISYYHYLGLPLGAPASAVLARVAAFRAYVSANWMLNKRGLERIVQEHLREIETRFASRASAAAYQAEMVAKAAAQRDDARDFARKHNFNDPKDARYFRAEFSLIEAELPEIIRGAGRAHTTPTPPRQPPPQPPRRRSNEHTMWNATSDEIVRDFVLPWLRALPAAAFAFAARAAVRAAGGFGRWAVRRPRAAMGLAAFAFVGGTVWYGANAPHLREYRPQRPSHGAAANKPISGSHGIRRGATPRTAHAPGYAAPPRLHGQPQRHSAQAVAHAQRPSHAKTVKTVNDLAKEIDP